jgi:hypothetical protein
MQFTDKAVYVAENNLKVKELLQEDAKYKEVSVKSSHYSIKMFMKVS